MSWVFKGVFRERTYVCRRGDRVSVRECLVVVGGLGWEGSTQMVLTALVEEARFSISS